MTEFYNKQHTPQGTDPDIARLGIIEKVKAEIKANTYQQEGNMVTLSEAHAYAAHQLVDYYKQVFTNPEHEQAFSPTNYLTDENEIRDLSAFFFWSGWVCGVERPGESYSYTHNPR